MNLELYSKIIESIYDFKKEIKILMFAVIKSLFYLIKNYITI